jgi:tetratricopeptide (TPR) repeat protein
MDGYGTYSTNYCSMHPDRVAVAHCPGCGENFCKECLEESGYCPACSSSAERFLEGFSGALSRWEANLREPRVGNYNNPSAGGKKLSFPRVIVIILLVLAGFYTLHFISNYHLYLGQMFLNQGNLPKAQYHFEEAVGENPDNADLQYILGNIYFQQGNLDDAIQAYRVCLGLDSLNARAMNNLAWTYAQLAINLEEALVLSKHSLEIEPDNPGYLDTIAEIYYLKKEYYRALTYIRKAVDLEPPNIEYYRRKMEKIKRLAYGQGRFREV